MEKPGTLFPRSFGSFLFPLLATMHAGEGAGGDASSRPTAPEDGDDSVAGGKNARGGFPAGGGAGSSNGGGSSGGSSSNGGGGGGRGGGGGGRGYGARAVRSPDERLALIVRSYGRAMCELAGAPDPEGHALLQAALGEGEGEGGSWGGRDGRHVERKTGVRGEREREGAEGSRRRGGDGGGGGGSGAGDGEGGGVAGAGGLAELMEKTRCGC